jgi:prolyl oligopeptidase
MFTVFEGDSRVDPCHARKLCAAMQHAAAGRPVVIRREIGVGHASRAVSRTVDLAADRLAFFAAHLGT